MDRFLNSESFLVDHIRCVTSQDRTSTQGRREQSIANREAARGGGGGSAWVIITFLFPFIVLSCAVVQEMEKKLLDQRKSLETERHEMIQTTTTLEVPQFC